MTSGLFDDPLALSMPDDSTDEDRWAGIGSDYRGRLLTVIYTWRGAKIRLISARRATPSERRAYEGKLV